MSLCKIIAALIILTLSNLSFGKNMVFEPHIINGQPVLSGHYSEIVFLHMADHKCTATIIGPRTLITAGHCIFVSPNTWFEFKGEKYSAFFYQSPIYIEQAQDDMAIGFTDIDIIGANPATLGEQINVNDPVRLFGYGCNSLEETGSGVLRYGDSVIQAIGDNQDYDFTASHNGEQGTMLCSGDSGGPTFVLKKNQLLLIGTNSATDYAGESYITNLTHTVSKEFIKKIIEEHNLKICGINIKCNPWTL